MTTLQEVALLLGDRMNGEGDIPPPRSVLVGLATNSVIEIGVH